MSQTIEVTPEMTAAEVAPPEFIDSAQSVDQLLASAFTEEVKNAGGTALRLFAFRPEGTTERLALVFVGPEAVKLSELFVGYSDALFNAVEMKKRPPEEQP